MWLFRLPRQNEETLGLQTVLLVMTMFTHPRPPHACMHSDISRTLMPSLARPSKHHRYDIRDRGEGREPQFMLMDQTPAHKRDEYIHTYDPSEQRLTLFQHRRDGPVCFRAARGQAPRIQVWTQTVDDQTLNVAHFHLQCTSSEFVAVTYVCLCVCVCCFVYWMLNVAFC
jgi:hypothetical protein